MRKIFLVICLLVVVVSLAGCVGSQTKIKPFAEKRETGGAHNEQDSVIGLRGGLEF